MGLALTKIKMLQNPSFEEQNAPGFVNMCVVFNPSCVRLDCRNKSVQEIARFCLEYRIRVWEHDVRYSIKRFLQHKAVAVLLDISADD